MFCILREKIVTEVEEILCIMYADGWMWGEYIIWFSCGFQV